MYEDFNHIAIYIELFVNFLGLVLAVILMVRARDNRLMFAWGGYTALLMGLLIYSNFWLLEHYDVQDVSRNVYLLGDALILTTFLVTGTASVFPLISLRPGWLNGNRRFWLASPLILSYIIIYCFEWFDGVTTPLHYTSDIFAQIHRPDVQMRVLLLALSVLTPLYILSVPFIYRWVKDLRKATRGMYIYCGATVLMIILYFFNAVSNSSFVFYIYGYALVLAPILVSVAFLYNENPLSQPIADVQIDNDAKNSRPIGDVMSPESLKVYEQMDRYMQSNTPFVDANYPISHLASALDVGQNLIIRAIRERGFSGYIEYVNFWRIEHFKVLARKLPGLSIKELMFASGFTSRSSFYRRFAQKENMSPKEYIERKL